MAVRILLSFVLILYTVNLLHAQYDYPRDTSYNIRSAYLKIKKNHPHVTPIQPLKLGGIQVEKEVVYADIGRDLTLDIFYPKRSSEKGYPGVLLIYGGGWSSGEKANQIPMAQKLAAAGYVAVVADYRLSPEAQYPAAMHDLKAAIRWMRTNSEKYSLNQAKIAVLGCSAGAQLATLLGTTGDLEKWEGSIGVTDQTTSVQAIINIDGIVSFIHPEASSEGEYAAKWLGGYKDEVPEVWQEASPLEYVNGNTPPTLFINSSQPRFHAGRDDMVKLLDKYHIYSEVHTLEDSPHSFWLVHPWFEPTYEFTVKFLDKVLK
ncbi:esterase [Marivirga lumbricoides]|uniref:Esterase n=1 Tax=Marivirga lumbricoides TaxID=1046115 RepID=A0A2T4DUA8_9BACT|nr:esterase [Marivirga lumbricoides]